jgi:hypothetical protein
MYLELTTFGQPERLRTGLDFSNNTWRAVRGLLSGANIYGPTHSFIPGIGYAWPASQHVPGSLLWQAPFAALPLPAAFFAFTSMSILAIWTAVFVLTRPRDAWDVFLTTCCGGFAICAGGGPMTLLLGQPTGFALLGLAILVRARRPWLAGLGFMLAATTLQTGLPLALALLLLGNWRVVWRGTVLAAACSLPPVSLEIANTGASTFVNSFVTEASAHLGLLSNRIDFGALLHRLGVESLDARVAASLVLAATAFTFLTRLPPHLRRIDYPPVLCLVIAFTLLATYHQPYDMLLVGGAVVPVILVNGQWRDMLPAFGLAGTSAALSSFIVSVILAPLALLGIGIFSALALRRAAITDARGLPRGCARGRAVRAPSMSTSRAGGPGRHVPVKFTVTGGQRWRDSRRHRFGRGRCAQAQQGQIMER